jgi:aspartyl-tRNA(Asn)/glutamyl-tRNA(Gln) amidotransferase subunit C
LDWRRIENMSIDNAAISQIAGLAKLALSDTESRRFAAKLETVLASVKNIENPVTSNIPPLLCPLPLQNVFRADVVRTSNDTETLLSVAVDRYGDYFKVPQIIE